MSSRPPRVVVVVDRPTFHHLEYDPEGVELLERPDVEIMPYPPEDTNALVEQLDARGLLEPGQRLVQSPYDQNSYARLDDARNNFAIEKHFAFAELCGKLGAKTVKIVQVEIKSEKGTDEIDVAGKHLSGISAKAKYHKEVLSHLEGRLTLEDRRDSKAPDIEAARLFLQKKRLVGDAVLESLIEGRDGHNPLKQRRLSVSLTDESTSRIQFASEISVPTHGSVKVTARTTTKTKIEYRLTYLVKF